MELGQWDRAQQDGHTAMTWRRLGALVQLVCLLPSARTIDDSTFVPPGVESLGVDEEYFGVDWEFSASPRMHGRRMETINTVNDWHYAMMNDLQRNEAFYAALQEVVTPRSAVLDIGAGSGLLSLMAASLGARTVLAVEGNRDIAALAKAVIERNNHSVAQGGSIKVVNQLSTDLQLNDLEDPYSHKANIVVSEIIGTLLLGESQLDYIEDARKRLLAPDAAILPAAGIQYATLIQSFDYANLTGVSSWRGFDLGPFNELRDTDSLLKSKMVWGIVIVLRASFADVAAAGCRHLFVCLAGGNSHRRLRHQGARGPDQSARSRLL